MIKFSLDKERKPYFPGGAWYDTKEGIIKSLETFSSFLRMLMERRSAGYDRDERMNEFYVLGRFLLDTCGNCGKAQGYIPKEKFPDIPDVMTRNEFFAFLKENTEGGDEPMISFSMESGLPSAKVVCPLCGEGWDIQNCHDTVMRHKTDVFSLGEFVGKTLWEVKSHYNQLTDAIYGMQPDILIRNDRFIDLSPKYPDTDKDWQKNIKVNERGWVSEQDGIDDDYVIQKGDEGSFNIWTYFHTACNRQHLAASEESEFRKIFEKAGFQTIEMEGITNQYCPHTPTCDYCAPWFNVRTEFGTIVIGWRKRVININWSDIKPKKGSLISLFKDEDITKGKEGIHAWGWEKAEDYLTRIRTKLAA